MIAMANIGKKDLPKTSAVPDRNALTRRRILNSFPLRLGWGRYLKQRRMISARFALEPTL
jgi:hypothetical protein